MGTWVQEAKLTASDGSAFDRFGESVSVAGDYAIVGASLDQHNGIFLGSAYVFKRNGAAWLEHNKLIPDVVCG